MYRDNMRQLWFAAEYALSPLSQQDKHLVSLTIACQPVGTVPFRTPYSPEGRPYEEPSPGGYLPTGGRQRETTKRTWRTSQFVRGLFLCNKRNRLLFVIYYIYIIRTNLQEWKFAWCGK